MTIYSLRNIETPRLLIRPIQLGDEIELNNAIKQTLNQLQRWMPWAHDPSLKTTTEFVSRSHQGWVEQNSNLFPMTVLHKKDQKILSATGFIEGSKPDEKIYELGYWLDSNYQGQGLVTELVNALTRYALIELKAHYIQICTHPENKKSIAVAQRCGYHLEKTLKNHRIDCKTQLPTDSLLFICDSIANLPPLEVSWE